MLLERGELDSDLGKTFNSGYLNELGDLACLSIAKNLLEIGKALATCGVVWGDVKPGNFVSFKLPGARHIYKSIDFDSSRRDAGPGASLRGPNISDKYSKDDSTAMVTRGYVSPERALAIKEGDEIDADSRQDVFVFGLVIYQLFAKQAYFGTEAVATEQYLETLCATEFVADLSAVQHKGAKKFLKEMLQRNPSQRKSFNDLLKHRVFDATSSVSMSQLATRSQMEEVKDNQFQLKSGQRQQSRKLDGVERKVDEQIALSDHIRKKIDGITNVVNANGRKMDDQKEAVKRFKASMVGYVQQLITTADLSHLIVEQLSIRQLSMMKKMDQKFETLEKSIVNVFQLMVNLQEADVPSFCFVTPSKFDDGAGWFAFATNFRQQMKSRVKWKHYYKLYVCDEGPLLLPDLCEKSEDPEHDGITIKLPGWLMLKVAPLLYVVAKMLQLALSSALPLIPIPVNIPYFKKSSSLPSMAAKTLKHQQKRLTKLVEGYRQITVQAKLEQEANAMLEEIHTSLVKK